MELETGKKAQEELLTKLEMLSQHDCFVLVFYLMAEVGEMVRHCCGTVVGAHLVMMKVLGYSAMEESDCFVVVEQE